MERQHISESAHRNRDDALADTTIHTADDVSRLILRANGQFRPLDPGIRFRLTPAGTPETR
jgi:hypothetical protein